MYTKTIEICISVGNESSTHANLQFLGIYILLFIIFFMVSISHIQQNSESQIR